ncbi:MAG: DLW-39 family protein [Frankiaceae bacterium]
MKRLLLLAVGVGAAAAYRRRQADRAEAELWAEATTPPDLR